MTLMTAWIVKYEITCVIPFKMKNYESIPNYQCKYLLKDRIQMIINRIHDINHVRVICVAVYNITHLSLTAEWPKHITHLSLKLASLFQTWQQL